MPAAAPQTVPGFFQAAFERFGDRPILEDRAGTVGLEQVLSSSAALASALERRGLARGDRVAFWADNSRRWIVVDLAIQLAGAIDVPSGTDTPDDEARELFAHAEVSIAFVHDAKTARRLEGLRAGLPTLRDVFVLDPEGATGADGRRRSSPRARRDRPSPEGAARVEADDVATIIYTSGTTGPAQGRRADAVELRPPARDVPRACSASARTTSSSRSCRRGTSSSAPSSTSRSRSGARLVYTDRPRLHATTSRPARPTFVPSRAAHVGGGPRRASGRRSARAARSAARSSPRPTRSATAEPARSTARAATSSARPCARAGPGAVGTRLARGAALRAPPSSGPPTRC